MKFKHISITALTVLALKSPIFSQVNALSATNPFYAASTLPFQAPNFSVIKNEHFKPAFEAGIQAYLDEIEQIANQTAAPTFDNTLVALEKAGQLFSRVNSVFTMISGANTNDTLQNLQEEIAPKIAALNDAIYLNSKLFNRIKVIYKNRQTITHAESKRLLEVYYNQFVLSGALLNNEAKEKLKKWNEEEAVLSAKFGNQLLAAAKQSALVVDNKDDLDGLTASEIASAEANASSRGLAGKYVLSLKNTTQQPLLSVLKNRKVRESLFMQSVNRASKADSNNTHAIILQITKLRAKKAHLLGFESYAAWKLKDQMAVNPKAIEQFFSKLIPAAKSTVLQEAKDLQQFIQQKEKTSFELAAWDWDFYAEQVRKAKYDLDEAEVKPYFSMYNVLEKGVFFAAEKLYGLTFKERKDLPVYHSDVRVFEVFETKQNKTKSIALLYVDFYKRDNKNGGAWMNNVVSQSYLLGTKPVIYNVCNFVKPANGEPALISFDDVTTMFHEFGHTLHGLFASQKYPLLSGTNTARDFVEFPSQFNEHWALEPSVLKNYAIHYKTNQTIPNSLVEKIKKASAFNKGYAITEATAAACLDLKWHNLTEEAAEKITDVKQFEQEALKAVGLQISAVPPRYYSPYFLHIWGNGYAAGYYAYQWTKMLEEQTYQWFKTHGGMTKQNGELFKKFILSKGNTVDYNVMFKQMTGSLPTPDAMIEELQLKK